MGVTAVALALAVLLLPRSRMRPAAGARAPRAAPRLAFNVIAAGAVPLLILLVVPLPWSLPVAAGAGFAAYRFLPREFSRPGERERLEFARQLPECCDLLAALLRVGLTDTEALGMVAGVCHGELRRQLERVARLRRLGEPARQAWRSAAAPQLLDLAAAMARHAETGSTVADVLERVAADARRDYFSAAQAAARAAAVRAVIPLAVCFLPAFFLLGVVPIVAALFGGLTF